MLISCRVNFKTVRHLPTYFHVTRYIFVIITKDVEATPDKDDSRSLHIVIQQPFTRRSKSGFNPLPVLTAKFVFDDYIRCMSARQRLQKRCDALRHRKMANIATLLELPALASPSNYYSITSSLDNSNAVWSPSSRGYSSSRNTSGYSSPNNQQSTPTTPSPSALSTPQTKPRILSPKMEQILQKQQGGRGNDDKKTPQRPSRPRKESHQTPLSRNTPSRTPRKEAVALASLLQTTPPMGSIEITAGQADAAMRQRSSTMEVGVEIAEECSSDSAPTTLMDASSSFVMLNTETSIERVVVNTPSQSSSTPKNTEANLSDNDNKSPILNIRRNATPSSKSQSAPGSPSGRRTGGHFATVDDISLETTLSKSLPAIELKSLAEERKQRAHRARVKANNAKKMNNKKHGGAGTNSNKKPQ